MQHPYSYNWTYKYFENIVKEDQLTYEDFQFPTFYIQSQGTPLNILYGSCRKIHDIKGGTNDALSLGDEKLEKLVKNLIHRPTILCLTGDQIYADDNLKCYPNPVNNRVYIKLNKDIELNNAQMKIFDVLGNEVANIEDISDHYFTFNMRLQIRFFQDNFRR